MKVALAIRESRSDLFFFPKSKIKRSDADVKINISKGHILMLVLPTFILIMFILEIICAKEIFNKFLTLGVVAFLYQLGIKIGSFDEKLKGISNRVDNLER